MDKFMFYKTVTGLVTIRMKLNFLN